MADALLVPKSKAPLWRRVRAWAIVTAGYAIVLGMAFGGVVRMPRAFGTGVSWDDRAWFGVTATGLLAPLFWVVWFFARNKWTTGRWGGTRGDRLQTLGQCRVQKAGNPQWSWITYVTRWAEVSATDRTAPLWKRVAGWAGVVMTLTVVVATFLVGLICVGAAFADDNTLTATAVFLSIAVAIFIVPILFVILRLRRKRETGSYFARPDDFVQVNAARVAWELRENQRSTRYKVMSTIFSAAVVAWVWKRNIVTGNWTFPAMLTLFMLYAMWVQFRRPKMESERQHG